MSVIDVIETSGGSYLIGEAHDNGVFGVRAEANSFESAMTAAEYWSRRHGVPISDRLTLSVSPEEA